MQNKILLTIGSDFSDYEDSWPNVLSQKLNLNLFNLSESSQGNGLISRKLIYKLTQLLKEYKPENIIVGIMWSGIDRSERYISDGEISTNVTSVVDGTKRWKKLNHQWNKTDKDCEIYYSIFNNCTSNIIKTTEHILRIQWYLNKMGIKYFMTTYMDIFNKNLKGEKLKLIISEVEHLHNLIDFSKFLPIHGCYEWVKENYPKEFKKCVNDDIDCPNNISHEKFTNEIIIPYLKEKNIINLCI